MSDDMLGYFILQFEFVSICILAFLTHEGEGEVKIIVCSEKVTCQLIERRVSPVL
jgi:hypothetical protein